MAILIHGVTVTIGTMIIGIMDITITLTLIVITIMGITIRGIITIIGIHIITIVQYIHTIDITIATAIIMQVRAIVAIITHGEAQTVIRQHVTTMVPYAAEVAAILLAACQEEQ